MKAYGLMCRVVYKPKMSYGCWTAEVRMLMLYELQDSHTQNLSAEEQLCTGCLHTTPVHILKFLPLVRLMVVGGGTPGGIRS